MHVLLAEHPADGRPPHVFVIAAHDDGPAGAHSAPCFVVACGCTDQFPLRPVDPSEAVKAVVAVASSDGEAGSDGLASPLRPKQAGNVDRPADAGEAISAAPIADAGSITEPRRTASDPGVFELHPDGAAWSWRLRDEHGDVVAVGKIYDGRDEARAAVDTVVRRALGGGDTTAQVVEVAK